MLCLAGSHNAAFSQSFPAFFIILSGFGHSGHCPLMAFFVCFFFFFYSSFYYIRLFLLSVCLSVCLFLPSSVPSLLFVELSICAICLSSPHQLPFPDVSSKPIACLPKITSSTGRWIMHITSNASLLIKPSHYIYIYIYICSYRSTDRSIRFCVTTCIPVRPSACFYYLQLGGLSAVVMILLSGTKRESFNYSS